MNDPSPPPYAVSWPRPLPEVAEALARVVATGDWGRYEGAECGRLNEELSQLHANQEVHLCSSGTVAVELALRGLGVRAGDEVLLAAYDFPGNFRAIEAIGAIPVLLDLADGSWTYDAERLKAAKGPRTVAAIVSHLHGELAPMPDLRDAASSMQLALLEDACQAPGGRIGDHSVGTFGDASVLSFGGSKLLTAGRGGAVLSHDPLVMQRVRVFTQRGNDAFPLSELQAAVLHCQLKRLSADNLLRHQRVQYLRSSLADLPFLQFPAAPHDCLPAYYKLGCRLASNATQSEPFRIRDEILLQMAARQIPIGAGFRGFANRSSRRCRTVGTLAAASAAAEQTLVLHHPVLLEDEWVIDELAAAIRCVLER